MIQMAYGLFIQLVRYLTMTKVEGRPLWTVSAKFVAAASAVPPAAILKSLLAMLKNLQEHGVEENIKKY